MGNKSKIFAYIKIFSAGIVTISLFQNCSQSGEIVLAPASKINGVKAPSSDSSDLITPTTPDSNQPVNPDNSEYLVTMLPAGGYICSALGTKEVVSEKSGLKCELRYLNNNNAFTTSQKNSFLSVKYFEDSLDYFSKVSETIYLNDVNVPTRMFTAGFAKPNGDLLKDNQGNTLIEYFALKMEAILKLSPNDEEGSYLLSTISDDGTVVQIKENNVWRTIITNDGAHATKMGCAAEPIRLTRNSEIPIRIYYNQGPRTEIANVLVWKKVDNLTSDSHLEYCGMSSSVNFWNPNLSSNNEGDWIKSVYNLGWSIVKPQNFTLPNDEVNPCAYDNIEIISSAKLSAENSLSPKLELSLTENALVDLNLYSVDELQNTKVKIYSDSLVSQNKMLSFEIKNLDSGQKTYSVELIVSTSDGLKKIRKEFKVSLTKK